MNCQEVMELMQRQLDGDLNSQEEGELDAHLAYCLDCMEMFERLQRLSGELAQLPKVVPPYSLVDAILPQLAEIDKGAAASITDKAAVFSTEVSQSEQGQPTKLPWTRRFGSQFSWKFAGGVVAAGLILGFFAFNLKHPVMENADGLLPMAASKQGAEQKRSMAASDPNKSQETADKSTTSGTPGANQFAENQNSDAAAEAKNDQKQEAQASGTSEPAPQATTNAQLEKPDTLKPSAPKDSKDATQMDPSTSAPERMKEPSAAGGSSQKVAVDPKPTSPPAPSTEPATANNMSATTQPTPTATPSAKKGTEREAGAAGMYLMTVPTTDNFLKSESGKLTAAVENHHVVIRDSDTLEIIFESKQNWQPDDLITLLEWSKDDKLFYQVQSGGTLHTIRMDVKLKKEETP
ncbi:zf-HC2 domain-containing protein [Paenibacillus aceris]|uniref:Anti-sigma-W factor RsiW n=1 Tax=Paenibacillus aceris TaxID=869555 RepID=A0ABS4HSB0_9BACL|nr:zf-HC2 domain-containing protein [Paenibacillus aceris]MBP1961507.1 hypothetical protein [Paenibacillus aceris]NHW37715.1 hypothetical protein [Paenibacillus aceris]